MNASPDPGEDRALLLTHRLIRAATALGRITSRVHKSQLGLTGPEFSVLLILGEGENASMTSSHIVDTTAMDKTKVSRAVSALDQRGWLTRTRATSDRRFEYLALRPEGRRAYDALMPQVRAAENEVLRNMTAGGTGVPRGGPCRPRAGLQRLTITAAVRRQPSPGRHPLRRAPPIAN